jgi:hypothetical protein
MSNFTLIRVCSRYPHKVSGHYFLFSSSDCCLGDTFEEPKVFFRSSIMNPGAREKGFTLFIQSFLEANIVQ